MGSIARKRLGSDREALTQAAMKKCTDCKKPSAILRSDYRKRNERDQWETIIRPDEQCCPKCAAKRGARSLQQIHAER